MRYIYIKDFLGNRHGVTVTSPITVEGVRGFYYSWGKEEPQFWAGFPGQGFPHIDYAYEQGGALFCNLIDRVIKDEKKKR